MEHSIIAPSSAHIWGKPNGCTGYVRMAATYPDTEDSQAAKEGTAAHEIGEILITMGTQENHTVVEKDVREALIGKLATNGEVFTEEMFNSAWVYANEVIREFRFRPEAVFATEHKIKAPAIHGKSFGTIDAYLYGEKCRRLIVWDYKHGYGVVEAYENWQAINYIAGLLDELQPATELIVDIRIVQPRAFHEEGTIRTWVTSATDLRNRINTLSNNAHKALGDNPTTKTGEHCRYCEALHACPVALKAGIQLYELAGKPLPVELNPQGLGLQLSIVQRARKQLEYLESAYEEQIKSLIRGGANVPGWSLETKLGRAKWDRSIAEVAQMGDMMGKNLYRPLELITPAQAIKRGLDKTLVDTYSKRDSGFKLSASSTDKAKQIFGEKK